MNIDKSWIDVKKRLPECPCYVWVIHERFYRCFPIRVFYDGDSSEGYFVMNIHDFNFPSSIPLEVTHYMEIPDL